MAKNALTTEYRRLADLKAYDHTARVHGPAQKRKAKSILRRFGQLTPILIDPDGVIVDGHLIAEQMGELGHDEIAVVVVEGRSDAELKAIRLALNRLPDDASVDRTALKAELQSLLEIGFDVEVTAFDTVEIDMTLAIDEESASEVEDAPPAPADGPPISRPGDLWMLGDHRIVCGDCRDQSLVARLMAGASARMAFTDPPYNVVIGGFAVGKGRHREFAFASGEMTAVEFAAFLTQTLTALEAVVADGAVAFACMDWRHLRELLVAVAAAGLEVINVCVWAKTNAGMGSLYRSQHELVFVLKKGGAAHLNNVELGRNGRSRSNLWSYRGMSSFGAERDELLGAHPTVKPVAMVADAIKDVSRRGDIVFDPFLGSGTTLIAAHRTGRRCYGVEIDPAYVDLIISRFEAETGRSAILEETGETFAERASTCGLETSVVGLLAGPAEVEG